MISADQDSSHVEHQQSISCLVTPHDAPHSADPRTSSLRLMVFFATMAIPVLLLASSTQQFAYRPGALPGTHGAATASGTTAPAAGMTGSVNSGSKIDAMREKRRAANPGVEPWHPSAPEHADNHTGVYLTISSAQNEQKLRDTIKALKERGETSIVVDAKGGRVHYASNAPYANELGLVNPYLDIDKVIRIAHEEGMYLIARTVTLKDDGLYDKVPAARVKNPKTGATLAPGWTDPASPETQRYNYEVFCELAQKGFDEINMDYIRFSTADFGNLRAYTGQEKADRLVAFIKGAREKIAECNPATKLGVSTFAIIGWNYDVNVETLGQDIKRIAPYVDIISPMAYPATFTSEGYYVPGKHPRSRMYWLVYRTIKGYADFLGADAVKLRPWIQGYYVDAKDMREQMDALTDAGACGFQVWNANNNYGPVYQAMGNWELPENCK